jgi:hypothetical protein
MTRNRACTILFALLLGACGDLDDDDIQMLRLPLKAQCSITVVGKGTKDLEKDYLPHVITCENGGASFEALKVQAVSARTFAYYKIATAGSVKDGTSDQVYSCASKPQQKHYDAVNATAGQVLVWSNVVICSFFVAGAKPSTQSCVALASDPDPTSTEKYVTYNAGKTGSAVKQSTLGWVSSTNKYNRGCMSQNGSHCQAVKGKKYADILRFYYGADIQIVTATGACVDPPPPPKPDTGVKKLDQGTPKRDAGAPPSPEAGAAPLDSGVLADLEPPREDGAAPSPDATAIPREPRTTGAGCNLAGDVPPAPFLPLLLVGMLLLGRGRR